MVRGEPGAGTGRQRLRHTWPVRSYVVTGGAQGVGQAIVQALSSIGAVVTLDLSGDPSDHAIVGDAADPDVAARAADAAERLGSLTGWVNNAAVFRDASLDSSAPGEVLDLIRANLGPAVVGTSVAVRRFMTAGTPGAVVNVSSHQAQRAVRGALPYATAKAAVEGFTRACAVDYGPHGIRTNAVALGSISTPRYERYLAASPSAEEVGRQMAALHPLGRVGTAQEVGAVVAFLLGDGASFVNGAVIPVDGGRAAQGADPEQA